MASDILVVDDETDIRELISGILEDEGHSTRLAKDSDDTLKAIEERRPSLVILDIWLQGSKLDGLELLDRIKKAHPDLPVIIISGHGNIETAVAAMRDGCVGMCSTEEEAYNEVPRGPLLDELSKKMHGQLARSDQVPAGNEKAASDAGKVPSQFTNPIGKLFIDYEF
jgi:CheY-like chemotaxis protein